MDRIKNQRNKMAARVPRHNSKLKEPVANAIIYLRKATEFTSQKNLTKAYEYFVKYFEIIDNPTKAPTKVQITFTKVTCEMGAVLEETDNVEELLKCYLQAINFFPENYVILNNLGGYMFKVGELDIARRYLEAAVKAKTNYLPAEKNLMHVKWLQLPRWHFRMLNDKRRNEAYAAAISQVIDEGYTNVVDIGAGCGLLSLIASKKSNANITAIEENKALVKMCSNILNENNASNVRLLHCNSTEFKTAPAPCNLIVTEIFDVALFGERALESLIHGIRTLVTYPKFKTVPASADLYVTGISSRYLVSRYRVINPIKDLNIENVCIRQAEPDPYDAENLTNPNLRVKYMTNTAKICHIDFSNSQQLDGILNNENFAYNVDVMCNENGWLYTLAVWFDLNLTDNIKITTNPKDEDCVSCWEQAIFHFEHPIYIYKNDVLHLKATVKDSQLKFEIVDRQQKCQCFEVTNDIVTFLNDELLVNSIRKAAESYTDTTSTIVDLNIFPLFGFLMAKKGCLVHHVYKDANDLDLYEAIIERNNIKPENMIFVDEKSAQDYIPYLESVSILFLEPIHIDGSLNKILIPIDKSKRKSIRVIPQSVYVKIQLVSSPYLDYCNKVDDANALNFNIAKHMNEYTGSEHPNLYFLNSTPVSGIITLKVDGEFYEKTIDVRIECEGRLNGILFWYDIRYSNDIIFTTSRSTHYRRSCALVENARPVKKGDTVKVTIKRDDVYLKITTV